MLTRESKHIIHTRVKEFVLPPFRDGLVLGRNAPIGSKAMRQALELLVATPFEPIEFDNDPVIQEILVRKTLLSRIPKEKLIDFVLKFIKPGMAADEILYLELDVQIQFEAEL